MSGSLLRGNERDEHRSDDQPCHFPDDASRRHHGSAATDFRGGRGERIVAADDPRDYDERLGEAQARLPEGEWWSHSVEAIVEGWLGHGLLVPFA